ncbi:MAG: ATP-dependent DNA helicase RecG [Aquiluna sp.]
MLENGEKLTLLGDKTSRALSKQLGITHVGQLLQHYPRRYIKRGELTSMAELPIGEVATVVGEIVSVSARYTKGRGGHILEATISDGTSKMSLAFFGQAWRKDELTKGKRGLFSGKVGIFSGKLQLTHPDYELFEDIDEKEAKAWADLPIPVYPATATLPSWRIEKAISQVLGLADIKELIPKEILEKEKVIGLKDAVYKIHRPSSEKDFVDARKSLKFHEALILQTGLLLKRQAYENQEAALLDDSSLAMEFEKHLEFEFTKSQLQVIAEIEKDLASGRPMHRLLQGEVGSGKTVIALRAIMLAAAKKLQSALLAPTEVLAEQHFHSIQTTLGPELSKALGVRLLTGSMNAAEKKKALLDMASGKCLLAVGTHALFSEKVQFAELGLVVIDEQHRFGVMQREAIKGKGKKVPHVLTMTATPIPRTIAITAFGDLDVSTLRELPGGRKAIETHLVAISNPALVSRVWQRVNEEIQKGRQVFVVCPRISGKEYEDEPAAQDSIAPAAATEVFDSLARNPALSGVRMGLMHGRLATEEKQDVMQAFAAKELDLLVATTVIEVGVNIPNATVMVILDADRFGISQLHQLRGRIGRGEHAGICLLLSGGEPESLAHQRLEAIVETNDGFKLSEMDLELRGEGDVLGENQSGMRSQLKMLKVTLDGELIQHARELGEEIVKKPISKDLLRGVELMQPDALAAS